MALFGGVCVRRCDLVGRSVSSIVDFEVSKPGALARDVAHLVACLPNMHKALWLIPEFKVREPASTNK